MPRETSLCAVARMIAKLLHDSSLEKLHDWNIFSFSNVAKLSEFEMACRIAIVA